MKRILPVILILTIPFIGCRPKFDHLKLETHLDTISYCIGVIHASNLHRDGFDTVNTTYIAKGLDDYVNKGKTLIDKDKAKEILIDEYQKVKERNLLEKYGDNKIVGEEFLDQNKTRPGVTVLPSGLQYEVIRSGKGAQPDSDDVVYVHYRGQLVDGTVFEDNFDEDPAIFGVNRVIAGWREILQHMHVGDHWKVFIPYQLGYGNELRPNSPIPPYSTLIFDIQLEEVQKEPNTQ